MAATNMGTAMEKRFATDFWLTPNASAMIRRAERKAVSPLVMGAATTPNTASTPPNTPSHPVHTFSTTLGALKNCTSVFPPSACAKKALATSGPTTSRHPP